MSNHQISSIGMGELDLASRLSQAEYSQADSRAAVQNEAAPARPEAPPPAKASPKALPNVSLHFKIDASTNEVTVLILDKGTREVIRTIPPDELSKLRQGELLELFG
jgi:hypothetical protein